MTLNGNFTCEEFMRRFKASLTCLLFFIFLLPHYSNGQSVMSVLKNHSEVSSFANALEQAQLDDTISGSGPYTIFAPSNEAFNNTTGNILNSSSRMRSLLLNHIMTGLATGKNLKVMSKTTSMGGIQLNFNGTNPIMVNDAEITTSNIKANNGVIHIINRVLE